MKRRFLNTRRHRELARCIRDSQWEFADKVARLGTVWVCWWDKWRRHHDYAQAGKPARHNVVVHGLIDGMELLEWLHSHKTWWSIGPWDNDRYAAPVRLTPAGRVAIKQRARFDLEPVTGGLVAPGWRSNPLRKSPA